MRKSSAKTIALYGMFVAAAVLFGFVEHLVPLSFIAPGMKLGIANLVFLYLLCKDKFGMAFFVNLVRILLSALLFATPFSLAFSLTAGICSMLVMWLASRFRLFGVVGISVSGGVVHNLVQLVIAHFVVGSGVWFYLPYLLIAGTVAGGLIGFVCWLLLQKTKRLDL